MPEAIIIPALWIQQAQSSLFAYLMGSTEDIHTVLAIPTFPYPQFILKYGIN